VRTVAGGISAEEGRMMTATSKKWFTTRRLLPAYLSAAMSVAALAHGAQAEEIGLSTQDRKSVV